MVNTEQLIYAAQISQRKGKNINAASTIKKTSIQSLVTEKKILKYLQNISKARKLTLKKNLVCFSHLK